MKRDPDNELRSALLEAKARAIGTQSVDAGVAPLVNLRDTGRFVKVLALLKCALVISRCQSGVAPFGATFREVSTP